MCMECCFATGAPRDAIFISKCTFEYYGNIIKTDHYGTLGEGEKITF